VVSDKGELRILGRRHVALDAEALCRHLDTCVGAKVAEVIMNNHEIRLGREQIEYIRAQNPEAAVHQILELILESDRITGFGVTRINLPANNSDPIIVEIDNPPVTRSVGAAKSIAFSYWAGALGALLGRELEVRDAAYDAARNLLTGRLLAR
jgi:hypothetical protein